MVNIPRNPRTCYLTNKKCMITDMVRIFYVTFRNRGQEGGAVVSESQELVLCHFCPGNIKTYIQDCLKIGT